MPRWHRDFVLRRAWLGDYSADPRARTKVAQSFHSTEVLDIVGPVTEISLVELFGAFEDPVVLRIRANESGTYPLVAVGDAPDGWDQATLYAFLCSRVTKVVVFCCQWDFVAQMASYPDVCVMSDARSLKKLVLNVSFDPDSNYAPHDIVDAEYPPSVEDVVFILRAVPGMAPPRVCSVPVSLEDIQAHFDVLFDNIGFFVGNEVKHILVNVGDLNALWIGADPSSNYFERVGLIRDKVRSDLRYRFPNTSPADVEGLLARNLIFFTFDEYRATMALSDFQLESEV